MGGRNDFVRLALQERAWLDELTLTDAEHAATIAYLDELTILLSDQRRADDRRALNVLDDAMAYWNHPDRYPK